MNVKTLSLPLTLLCLLLSSNSYSQFKKFKSKTRLNNNSERPQEGFIKRTGDSDDDEVFGRGTGVGENGLPQRDKKFVNLNPETAFGPEVVTSFDFPETTLVDLTKYMQSLTGINLILDKDLKGKVSIMAPTPITVGDAWKAYLTALNLNGYTLVPSGSFYKIVNSRDIRYTPTKIYTGNFTPNTENYVMRILPLKNINSTEVTRSFRPFMSRYGRIIDIKQTNTIIVQDTGSNINRLVRLIKFIDVPGHEESLQILKMKYSSAQEIAKLLDKILKTNTGKSFKGSSSAKQDENISKIIAEPRTNSIIAMANAEGAKQLRALIAKLDMPGSSASGGLIHVYYLKYNDSETLSKTLNDLVSSSKGSSTSKTSRFARNAQDSTSLFNADVKITADKNNNAIVVTASPTDYLTIKNVISKLDIPRDQVYVEGLMMETVVQKNSGFGISLFGAYGTGALDKGGFLGNGGGSNIASLLTNNITSLGGLFIGGGIGAKAKQTVGGSEVEIKSINGLITAIANSGNTNVLATPQILALDNVEAVFEVGEQIPVPERTNAANGQSTVAINSKNVTLKLKIKPQINKVTRFVKLKIDYKIDDFSNRALPDGVKSDGVATTTRAAVTEVVVRDRDTIAMGGLMRDKESFNESKVPLLGDIPILGWLFKNTQKQTEKVNLLFFLTPRILANTQGVAGTVKDVLNRRSSHLKEFMGEDDSFTSTAKGLYDKAKKQQEGPLYDKQEAEFYKRQNDGPGIGTDEEEEKLDLSPDLGQAKRDEKIAPGDLPIPNYGVIVQKIKTKKSALKKGE